MVELGDVVLARAGAEARPVLIRPVVMRMTLGFRASLHGLHESDSSRDEVTHLLDAEAERWRPALGRFARVLACYRETKNWKITTAE